MKLSHSRNAMRRRRTTGSTTESWDGWPGSGRSRERERGRLAAARRRAAPQAGADAAGAGVDAGPGPGDRDPLRAGRDRQGRRDRAYAREEGGRITGPQELVELVEGYLDELALTPELGELAEPIRYALAGGGKRIGPVLALATGEALGREPEELLPAGAALELVHNCPLVHDDLPSLDNDELRRGRPSTWAHFDEATAVLVGDALLAEALRLALSYPSPFVARELIQATLGMIGGQHADTKGIGGDLEAIHRLKTGRLFYASVACALWVAEVPEAEQN